MTALAAIAIAALVSDGPDVGRLLARIGGPIGVAARAELARLDGLDAGACRQRRARWAAEARAPVPAGWRGVHASWIEHALAAEPAAARAAVASGGESPLAVWLARRVTAAFPALPAARAVWPASVADAIACDADTLARWLTWAGADQLAVALGAAGGDALARAASLLGPDGNVLVRAATEVQARAVGGARAAVARCAGLQLPAPFALCRIGARAVAPHVAGLHRELAARLPRPLGLAVAAELVAHAGASLETAPTWAALAVPRGVS